MGRRGARFRLVDHRPEPDRPEPADLASVAVTGADEAPTIANGLVTVEVDPATGTFSLDGTAGLGQLVDDGDAGDTYNYSPPRAGPRRRRTDARGRARHTSAGPCGLGS